MFNAFKKILNGETLTDSDIGKINQFVLLRWLSGDPRLMPLANTLNASQHLPDGGVLANAISKALKRQIRFIKYPSARKEDQEKSVLVEKISDYFEVGPQEAKEYFEWCQQFCPSELAKLKKIYKINE